MLSKSATLYEKPTIDTLSPEHNRPVGPEIPGREADLVSTRERLHTFKQMLRFALVGGLNTLIDLLILNGLLWLFPTNSSSMLLAYNSLAYTVGAINSFLLNKYWTFGQKQRTTHAELARFALVTACGIAWSSAILWFASRALHAFLFNATVWANVSKLVAIGGTAIISYLGMRLWVFVSTQSKRKTISARKQGQPEAYILPAEKSAVGTRFIASARCEPPSSVVGTRFIASATGQPRSSAVGTRFIASATGQPRSGADAMNRVPTAHKAGGENGRAANHSLSVVLPAYNEEQIIAYTVSALLDTLGAWGLDFEIIVVNDGSPDDTGAIVAALADSDPRIRLVAHTTNQGYGAALASGFAAATKDLTLFMDSDGQFDIRDLAAFFPFIDEYDAVIGYRLQRQDSWMRKLNAWGWKCLIGFVLDVHVRDIDCAFKLLHTGILHQHPLETRGAMINAELLYRLKRAGYTWREVGVQHLPRQGGRATGAKLTVIARAFRELFVYARKWRGEEKIQRKSNSRTVRSG